LSKFQSCGVGTPSVHAGNRDARIAAHAWKGLSTPALTIDLDILEANLDRMASYCNKHGIGLRPHTKTHKTPELARLQIDRGAVGLTVAKVGEAEVMADAGLDDILVAYPVWGEEKLHRLAMLARTRNILLSLDSEATAHELSRAMTAHDATIGLLVEFDTGVGRCGVEPGAACVELAAKVAKLKNLKFRGLMTYCGSIWGTKEERQVEAARIAGKVRAMLRLFEEARIPIEIVSGGSTPAALLTESIPGITEIRPGTYVYNDLNTFYQGVCGLEDCAARVITTVVSTVVPGRAILDAGSKTLSSDLLSSGPKSGYGYIVEMPDAPIFSLSEEHGSIDISNSARRVHVGDVLTLIPNHVCTCVNMHDEAYLLRSGQIVGKWRVAARGKVR
jgi:D-serine deaminase-like pyridoxal phosphate-dependent protein